MNTQPKPKHRIALYKVLFDLGMDKLSGCTCETCLANRKTYKYNPKRAIKGTRRTSRINYRNYLPTPTGPGKFLPTVKTVVACKSGWHLTPKPEKWGAGASNARVFRAEGYGTCDRSRLKDYDPKVAFSSIRLLYEVKQAGNRWVRKETK